MILSKLRVLDGSVCIQSTLAVEQDTSEVKVEKRVVGTIHEAIELMQAEYLAKGTAKVTGDTTMIMELAKHFSSKRKLLQLAAPWDKAEESMMIIY